jgi:hypothetical protein
MEVCGDSATQYEEKSALSHFYPKAEIEHSNTHETERPAISFSLDCLTL